MSKRKLEGIAEVGSVGKYPKLAVDVQSLTRRVIKCSSDLQKDSNLVLTVAALPDQLIRFPQDAFSLTAEVKWAHAAYKGPTGTTNLEKAEYVFLRGSDQLPAAYLEPAVSAAAIFSEIQVEINGYPLEAPALGKNGWVFNAFNRTFTSDKIRRAKYDADIPRVSTGWDRDLTNLDKSPDMMAALKMMDFDSAMTSLPKVFRFGFDCVMPFSFQSCISTALANVTNENGFLPPGTSVKVTLVKRDPMSACMENPHIPDSNYYTDTPNGSTVKAQVDNPVTDVLKQNFTWTLKNLELTYESLTLTSQERMDKIRQKTSRYYVDVPRVLFQSVPGGHQFTESKVQVPVGCRWLALTFMRTHQIKYNPIQFKNMSARFHFIPGAEHLELEMEGKPLIFDKGIKDCGVPERAHISGSCIDLHRSMVHRGLYSKPFSKMFPKSGFGDDQAIIVDLTHKTLKEPSEIIVSIKYKNVSPENWYLAVISCQQYLFTLKDKRAVEKELLI